MHNKTGDILNIGAAAVNDNSIVKKEYYAYTPYTNSFDASEEIRIAIHNQDLCLLPSESYLYMQLKFKTENYVAAADDAEKIKTVFNYPSFLFSNARYELNGVEIDRLKNVGVSSTLKLNTATSSPNTTGYYFFNKTSTDRSVANEITTVVYDVMLPLKVWFGFCEDYKNVILNSRHELILTRARDSVNCLHGGKTTAGSTNVSIEVTKLEWQMPHITLADPVKMNMNRFLQKNKMIPIQHRSWDLYEYPELPLSTDHIWTVKTVTHLNRPRYVIVAFHHDKKNNKTADASKFDIAFVNHVRLYLNSQVFPYSMNELDIRSAKIAELYEAYTNIQTSYYNGVEKKNRFTLGFADFQRSPMYAFDVSRSDESVKNGTVDIKIEIKASNNVPAKCTAYCLIIYDNEFVYSPLNGTVERLI